MRESVSWRFSDLYGCDVLKRRYSMELKRFCDKCGKEIKNEHDPIS